jgi:hypothetical protein
MVTAATLDPDADYVGIGTRDPQATLDVAGTVRLAAGSAASQPLIVAAGRNLAFGQEAVIQIYSRDGGATWYQPRETPFDGGSEIDFLGWNGTHWLAAGRADMGGSWRRMIATSETGTAWQAVLPAPAATAICWDGSNWYAFGEGMVMRSSRSGRQWQVVLRNQMFRGCGRAVAFDGRNFLVGRGTTILRGSGSTWTEVEVPFEVGALSTNGRVWLAAGTRGIWASEDGFMWTLSLEADWRSQWHRPVWNGSEWAVPGWRWNGEGAWTAVSTSTAGTANGEVKALYPVGIYPVGTDWFLFGHNLTDPAAALHSSAGPITVAGLEGYALPQISHLVSTDIQPLMPRVLEAAGKLSAEAVEIIPRQRRLVEEQALLVRGSAVIDEGLSVFGGLRGSMYSGTGADLPALDEPGLYKVIAHATEKYLVGQILVWGGGAACQCGIHTDFAQGAELTRGDDGRIYIKNAGASGQWTWSIQMLMDWGSRD